MRASWKFYLKCEHDETYTHSLIISFKMRKIHNREIKKRKEKHTDTLTHKWIEREISVHMKKCANTL